MTQAGTQSVPNTWAYFSLSISLDHGLKALRLGNMLVVFQLMRGWLMRQNVLLTALDRIIGWLVPSKALPIGSVITSLTFTPLRQTCVPY